MRVMTLNIWNYTRPWKARRELIAAVIQRYQPDAVALQEIRHDWRFERGRGQGSQLADLTDYHATSAVAQVYVPLLRVDEGLTILTRSPARRVMQRRLTRFPHDRHDENQRICLGVTVEDEHGHTLDVYDTHFSLSPQARISNAVETAQFIAESSGDHPAVVMGDLNAEPDTPPILFLTGQEAIDGNTGDFVDCWVAARGTDLGFTYGSADPVRRIDYVLGRHLPHGVRHAEVIGNETSHGVYPSDHMGIVVDLDL